MKEKSFTLIELLVVIAIIGVIASIVLVNLKGTREKATIARGLQFSNSLNNALGADAVGIWSFDAISGNTVFDLSGYNNNGTLKNGATVGEGIIGKGGRFDVAANDRLDVPYSGYLNLAGDLTIEAWIKPKSIISWTNIVEKGRYTQADYQLAIGSNTGSYINRLVFDFWSGGAWNTIFSSKNNDIEIGVWQHVAVTVIGNKVELYKNGISIGTTNKTKNFEPTNDSLAIGGVYNNNNQSIDGLVDEVRIYNRGLYVFEIQKHHVEGLEKHKLVEK